MASNLNINLNKVNVVASTARKLPYLPQGRQIEYISESDKFMVAARNLTQKLRDKHRDSIVTASIIVKDDKIIGQGTNKPTHGAFCPRTAFRSRSGEDYELCKNYCHSDNHSEARAIYDATQKGFDLNGADLYLYGHWWICKPCWDKIMASRINQVFLMKKADQKFYQAVSLKGEPNKALTIYLEHGQPISELSALLQRVNISLTEDKSAADYVFRPSKTDLTVRSLVVELHEALDQSGVYRTNA